MRHEPKMLQGIEHVFNRGIERETLRCDASGQLALTPHSTKLGAKLSHPYITTDFSESQLELITPVSTRVDDAVSMLSAIHTFTAENLDDELLWPFSMPCNLPADDAAIPLADYGISNPGLMKKTYRRGLGMRYGRSMQTICAIHYNLSFSDEFWAKLGALEGADGSDSTYRSKRYFDLMRNFRRWSWLLLYLFGASPVVAASFVHNKDHALEQLTNDTYYLPFATSLQRPIGLSEQHAIWSAQSLLQLTR